MKNQISSLSNNYFELKSKKRQWLIILSMVCSTICAQDSDDLNRLNSFRESSTPKSGIAEYIPYLKISPELIGNIALINRNGFVELFPDLEVSEFASDLVKPQEILSRSSNLSVVIPYHGLGETGDVSSGPLDNNGYAFQWRDLTFSESSNKANNYTLIIRSLNTEGDFDMEFYYKKLEPSYEQISNDFIGSSTSEAEFYRNHNPFMGMIAGGNIVFELPISQRYWGEQGLERYNNGMWTVRSVNNQYTLLLDNNLQCVHTEPLTLLNAPGMTPAESPTLVNISSTALSSLEEGDDVLSEIITLPFSVRLQSGGELLNKIRVSSNGYILFCHDSNCRDVQARFSPLEQMKNTLSTVVSAYLADATTASESAIYYGESEQGKYSVRWQELAPYTGRSDSNPEVFNSFNLILHNQQKVGDIDIELFYEDLQWRDFTAKAQTTVNLPFSGIARSGKVEIELPLSRKQRVDELDFDYRGSWRIRVRDGQFTLDLPRSLSCRQVLDEPITDTPMTAGSKSILGLPLTLGCLSLMAQLLK